jgi:hypothetical protein
MKDQETKGAREQMNDGAMKAASARQAGNLKMKAESCFHGERKARSLSNGFRAFLTTNHYPLTTAFDPPPHAFGTHPPINSDPTPHAVL